jgi:hypothetical protein
MTSCKMSMSRPCTQHSIKHPPFVSVSVPNDADVRRWLFRVASHRSISFGRHRRVLTWELLDHVQSAELNRLLQRRMASLPTSVRHTCALCL